MIALSIALVILGAMALYAWTLLLQLKFPKANSPEAEFKELKERVGRLELAAFTRPPIQRPIATINTRLG
jgi:hypothetical protein